MSKVKIKYSLNSNSDNIKDEITAIHNEEINTLIYNEKDKTKVRFNYSKNELTRENNDLVMKFIFDDKKATIGNILVKSLNKKLDVNIKTRHIKKEKNKYEIEYIIEQDKFKYIIEVI